MGLLSNEQLFGKTNTSNTLDSSSSDIAPLEAAASNSTFDVNFNDKSQYGAFDVVPELGKGITRGFLNIGAGLVGTADWLAETVSYPIYLTLSDENKAKVDAFNKYIFDDPKRNIIATRGNFQADPENAVAWAGAAIGEAIPYLASSIASAGAASIAAGAVGASAAGTTAASMAGAAGISFAVEGEMLYQNAIDHGATERQANIERIIGGSINAAIETLQVGRIVKRVENGINAIKKVALSKGLKLAAKQGGTITSDLAWTAIAEGLEEAAQEVTSILVPAVLRDDVARNEDGSVNWYQYLNRVGSSALGGAVVGGVFGGAKIVYSAKPKSSTGFNEFSLPGANSVVRAGRTLPKLTRKEKAYAKVLAENNGLSIKEASDIIASTTERRMDAPLTKDEKIRAVKMQLGNNNTNSLYKHKRGLLSKRTVDSDAVNDVLNWVHENGGVPVNPDMRNDFMSDIRNASRIRTKQIQKGLTKELQGKEYNMLNSYQAIRYSLGNLGVASGHNLHKTWATINTRANEGKGFATNRMQKVYDNMGIRPIDMTLTHEENNAIAEYLFNGDDSVLSDLSKNKQQLANELNSILQDDGKKIVSSIRWKMWSKQGIAPDSIKKKNRESILKEGQKAEVEGKLEEWLSKQKWAAKEKYYMSEAIDDDYINSIVEPRDGLTKRKSRKPGSSTRAAHTRRGKKAEWKKGSVVDNIHAHLNRLSITNNVMEDLGTFWNQFQDANPSTQDNLLMKKFINNVTGRKVDIEPLAKVMRNATSFFWRFHFLNPAKSAYFFTRNILQNAYMGNQMAVTEVIKAGKQIISENNSNNRDMNRVNAFNESWENSISQKQQMWKQALMMETESTVGGKYKSLYNKALYHADMWGSWAIKSDSINRSAAWNLYYTGSSNVMAKYNAGKLNWDQVQKKLKLDGLHYSQRMEMLQLTNNPIEFNKRYAEYKTENTHFRYETGLRSGAEQSVLSRSLAGLMVYPRGVANLAYTNGFVPMLQGLNSGNYRQAYTGLKNVLALGVGMSVARMLLKDITGRDSYGMVPEWQPLGPGVTIISENIDRLQNVHYQMSEGNLTSGEAVEKILMIAADNAEIVIPILDIWADAYESINNKSGVRFSKMASNAVKNEYPNYKYTNRTFWEKISHVLWGGGYESGSLE